MEDVRFDRDPRKEAQNRRKHGVSFAEAETVFSDDYALLQEAVIRIISARRATRKEQDIYNRRWRV